MKVLRQVKPNKGVEAEYRKRLKKLVDAMDKSVMYWILADYGNRTAREMAEAIRKRVKQWNRIFGEKAGDIALWFAKTVRKHTEVGFGQSLREKQISRIPTVSKRIFDAVRIENEGLIKSIPEKYFTGIETIAMLALLYDWDKEKLRDMIEKRHGITERRVKNIASDQTHKSTMIFKRDLCAEMGIRYAKWVYTYRSETPRESHVMADGALFDIDVGCLIDGEFILPGEKINCKCDFKPVVEDLGEDLRSEVEKTVYYKNIARGVK